MTQVNVPVGMTNFVGAGGISVQLPKGSSLATQIETLSKLPGNEYLVDLANRKDIDWQQVDVINKTWDHKKEGLTQEAAIIVAIVVTIFTAGAASSAGVAAAEGAGFATATTAAGTTVMATAGGTAFAAATAAAVTTLATQATIALINSQGDIGAALQEMASEQNLKVLATSVITAGLVQGLGSAFNLPSITGAGAGTNSSLIDKLQVNLINSTAGALVSSAINGGNLEDNLKAALKNAIIASIAAQGAGLIGDAKFDGTLDTYSGTLAHAILGCAMGSASTGNSSGCTAGAGGAVIGDLSAEWYGSTFGGDPKNAADFAKLTTALVAAAGGVNAMNIAGMTSNNAVVNNWQVHFSRDLDSVVMGKLANHRANAVFRNSPNEFSSEIKSALGEPIYMEGKGYGYVLEDLKGDNTKGYPDKLYPAVNDEFSVNKLKNGDIVTHQTLPDNYSAEDRLLMNYANDIARAKQTNGASLPDYPSNGATAKCTANFCDNNFYNSNTSADARLRDSAIPVPPANRVNVPGTYTDRQSYPGQLTIDKINNDIRDGIRSIIPTVRPK